MHSNHTPVGGRDSFAIAAGAARKKPQFQRTFCGQERGVSGHPNDGFLCLIHPNRCHPVCSSSWLKFSAR